MASKILDKILWLEGFYPFSMKYDLKKAIIENEKALKDLEVDPTTESILQFSHYFNLYFSNIREGLGEVLSKSTLDKSTFIELLIADLNRTELLVSEDTKSNLTSGSSYDSNMPANVYIENASFQNKKEPVWGLIDSAIETTTLNLNYLKYVKFDKKKETIDELSQVDVIANLTKIGSIFNAIKQSYDRVIWRGGEIKELDSEIKLSSNQHDLMLENVALTRLIRNISNTQNELFFSPEDHKEIIKDYHKARHFQVIKSIEKVNDTFVLKYQSKSKKPTASYIAFVAPIITYYPFFHLEKIQMFDNLTILDLVNLFSSLCDFVMALPIPHYEDTEVKDLGKFKSFNPKVKKSLLLEYYKKTTKYSEKQVLIFLNLLSEKQNVHNLFLKPIYEDEDYYFFAFSTIKRANMLYLVDKWLTVGNCDLAERGFKFEDYIKDFLRKEKLNVFSKFKLVEQSKFSYAGKNGLTVEEEIDLVLTMETTILVAEIKCITYPYDPNDFYTSFQTIKKAKNQVLRKSKFLEDNWEKFENILGKKDSKKIEKLIIVNFPHYAGRIVDGVPVSDFYLFLSYFKSGKFTNVKIERGKGMTKKEIPYYECADSFEKNLGSFFLNPVPIHDLIGRQKIEEYEVTPIGSVPKTLADRIVYVEKTPDEY